MTFSKVFTLHETRENFPRMKSSMEGSHFDLCLGKVQRGEGNVSEYIMIQLWEWGY